MEELLECDSDSDDLDFYEPVAKEVEEFLNNTDDTASIRSSVVSSLPISLCNSKDDEEILNINNALLLNKQTEAKYKQLEEGLYKILLEIRKKIEQNSKEIMSHTKAASNFDFNYIRSGKPYFKDKNNFVPPDNPDTIAMRQADMCDFYKQTNNSGWTMSDKSQLVEVLTELSRDIRKKELNTQIAKLKREQIPGHKLEINKIKKQIPALKNKPLEDIVLPLDEDYDWEYVANKFNLKHTAQEYQSLWKLFLHPSINRGKWSKAEHKKLQTIASQMKMQNWDLISKSLGTGRTGYQCFVYYRSNIANKSTNCKWSEEEIEYLHRVIEYFREGPYIPWGKVATAMDNRTKAQVYNKYTRLVEARKGRFLEEEDVVMLNCYDKYGLNFKKMAQYLPGRSIVQIRTRFNILTRFKVSTTWTIADDRKLLQIMANQDNNTSFSTATKHFPGKDRMHIRSRYLTLTKWMKTHPATDIALAPRRGPRRLVHGYANMSLNEALTNLNKRMQSEVQKKKMKKLTRDSSEEDIENAIMGFLFSEMKNDESNRKQPLNESDIEEVLNENTTKCQVINITNLKRMLIMLNASINNTKFRSSNKYGNMFKTLGQEAENSEVKVKSYSKNEAIKTIHMNKMPDIWGKVTIGPTKYVLPPNFATLTGCRALLKFFNHWSDTPSTDDINLSLMAQRNSVFQEALTKLKNRFTTLFLWPILLSNELPPKSVSASGQQEISTRHVKQRHPPLPQPTGVTIPICNELHLKNESGVINLSATNSSNAEVNIENPVDTAGCSYMINYDSD